MPEVAVPTGVACLDEVAEAAVLNDGIGNLESTGKCVHSADMAVEEVDGFVGFTSALGIEVESTGGEAAHVEDNEHYLGGQIDVGWELVGIPANKLVPTIGVDGPQGIGIGGNGKVVLHGVSCKGCVVGLDVELEVLEEIVLAEEIQAGSSVGIILVGRRLAWFWLNVEGAVKADFLFPVHRHVHESGKVVELALHVGVD